MTTHQVNIITWAKTLSLDRHAKSQKYIEIGDRTPFNCSKSSKFLPTSIEVNKIAINKSNNNVVVTPESQSSINISDNSKRNLEETIKVFLCANDDTENGEQKKTTARKISFKCKKASSYRRSTINTKITNLNPSTVSELTSKFNKIVAERSSILEQPKFARLLKRVSSQKSIQEEIVNNKKVTRKPSVKIKQSNTEEDCVQRTKNFSESTEECEEQCFEKTDIDDIYCPIVHRNMGSVRATIEIFERRTSQSSPDGENKPILTVEKVPKPKVPEKSPNLAMKKPKIYETQDFISAPQQCNSSATIVQLSNNEHHEESSLEAEPKTETQDEVVQILNIPLVLPKKCDSNYETTNFKKFTSPPPPRRILRSAKSEKKSEESSAQDSAALDSKAKPNSSFLWRQKSHETISAIENTQDDWGSLYDTVEIPNAPPRNQNFDPPAIPPRPTSLKIPAPKTIFKKKMPLPDEEEEEKIYEELESTRNSHNYEYCHNSSAKYEDLETKSEEDYECFETSSKEDETEKIYETLPAPILGRRKEEPLPPRPSSTEYYSTEQNSCNISNCYESIYNTEDKIATETVSNNYESIYGGQNKTENWESTSNRDSLSSGQQSNSLYGRSLSGWANEDTNIYIGKATSDLSGSDKSDEWVDISDNDDNYKGAAGFVIVREKQKTRKASGWSQKIRDQWNKSHSQNEDDPDHHYESLYNNQQEIPEYDDYDSFDSDTDSEYSFSKAHQNDSGVDMSNSQLPDPPSNQSYGLTKLAESAGKHMRRLRRNWSLTKNDITKSLSRMAKRKSKTELDTIGTAHQKTDNKPAPVSPTHYASPTSAPVLRLEETAQKRPDGSQLQIYQDRDNIEEPLERMRTNSLGKSKFLNKFRRSTSANNNEADLTQNLGNKPKSTFYITEIIDPDSTNNEEQVKNESCAGSKTSNRRHSRSTCQRPQSPPPPIPIDASQTIIDPSSANNKFKRSTSWYAECGLFRVNENSPNQKRPNTSWYAEIGLYQSSTSTPSTSSAENSGSTTHVDIKRPESGLNTEEYYNLKNENNYYNQSITSLNSDATLDKFSNTSADIQLRLQDEPLYQFYDAAVVDSACQDDSSEYDGYEEVGDKGLGSEYFENRLSTRPTAMQLILPSKNGTTLSRTLWCEIPEVLQSAVLSTLSTQQKKIQEAKFEMMTSEASYLNSLNVLTDHFITNLKNSEILTNEEKNTLFGKIPLVKECSEKLLYDLERCWQDNILLHDICDIIKRHAEENFHVYVSYCENQILLDSTLKKIRERNNCAEFLKQLECSSACHSLTLYSFLMLPMQRITRWPLLVDAVLKRLSPQDEEYLSCQYTLATINKIVIQCNEAARNMERETEIKRISAQIEFPRTIQFIKLASGSRWLVRSGPLIKLQSRAEDTKLTFGKRFNKINLHLYLFNDLLLITKPRNDDSFVVVHYCYRSFIEVSVHDTIGSLPTKDTQGRNLLFLTILENHEGKTVEMLLSCNSESDKERWFEALSAPKSDDPNETLYECWDCPQVTAIHSYIASQPDELPLSRGDIVNVTRKVADGWYHGERIRDGHTGWFPANYTMEVANPHVRARNLRQRYRLLAYSENYLKSK